MSMLHELWSKLRHLLRPGDIERGLDEEMRLHVELRAEALRNQGLAAPAARDAARRRFGNPLRLREESMDAWRWTWPEHFGQDLRFGARTLLKNPGFAATAVLTLALATGATTAIFSIVNGVLLRPLPFDDPERLVKINGRMWREDRGGGPDPMSGPLPALERDAFGRSNALENIAGYEVTTRLLHGATGVERLNAALVEPELFSLLGVDARLGRTFRSDDAADVVVISARFWEQRFNRDVSLPGRVVSLDGRPFTVIGVMAESFQFPYRSGSLMQGTTPESRTDAWIPLVRQQTPDGPVRRGRLHTVARLKPAVTREAAIAELDVIAARLEAEYRARQETANVRVGFQMLPLVDAVVGPVRRSLWLLFAAVGLVLAAACANVANLLLARMSVRGREVVTRAALGAGPSRLARQFLAESLLLSCAGGLVGAAIAWWGTDVLMKIAATRIPRAHEVALDWQAFAFLLIACVSTAVLFGLAPALTAARMDAHNVAKEAGRATMGRGYRTVRDGLVVLEVALAFVLAIGAALVVREMIRLQRVDTGMVTEDVLTLHLTPKASAADYYAIEERVSRLPGVQAAGFIQLVPLQNWGWEADFAIKARPPDPSRPRAELRYVTPGYFRALGIPLVHGRFLNAGDTAQAPRVILINEALARRYFGDEDPTGRELDRGTVAGVVGNVRHVGLDRPAEPEIYYPAAQNVTMAADLGMALIVRTAGAPEPHTAAIRGAVHEVNPTLAIFNVKPMTEVVDDSLWQLNLYRWLIGLFATLAVILAIIGLYGVISYTASARTREFAIRLALGSEQRDLARLVLSRALGLTTVGLASGILLSTMLTSSSKALGVSDGPTAAIFAATSLLVVVVALAACTIPALRAAAVDPASALRHD
jgi:putative ABC transport system permease protein